MALPTWDSPPGYEETTNAMKQQWYGWAVITSPGGSGGGHIAVVAVRDWATALATMPYRWLNLHPRQPAPVGETLVLAEETWKQTRKTAT